jgi:hypothetical protein
MGLRLSYYLTADMGIEAVAGACAWLTNITPMKPEQWEIRLAKKPTGDPAAWDVLSEFPNLKIPQETQSVAACEGRYVIPLQKDSRPSGDAAIKAMLIQLEKDSSLAAVVAKLVTSEGAAHSPALPSLAHMGATCFRKSVLDKIDGLPAFGGAAADYDVTFRILSTRNSIARREDIIFFTDAGETDAAPSANDIANQLAVAHWYLPPKLARIYWDDWAMRLKALGKRAGQWAVIRARMNGIKQMLAAPDPVSDEVTESVFGFRAQAAAIGEWARRGSVWRVVLADFGDNLWTSFNACRSSGLQMRCVADNNSAFEKLTYRELPIVHANRAFEGGGIDGVIVTDAEPGRIDATYKSIRNHFHGPILRLWQTPRQATHAEAQAA